MHSKSQTKRTVRGTKEVQKLYTKGLSSYPSQSVCLVRQVLLPHRHYLGLELKGLNPTSNILKETRTIIVLD